MKLKKLCELEIKNMYIMFDIIQTKCENKIYVVINHNEHQLKVILPDRYEKIMKIIIYTIQIQGT